MNEGNTAQRQESQSIGDIVRHILEVGFITKDDQTILNQAGRAPVSNLDISAIRHLTDLIREGVIKVQ